MLNFDAGRHVVVGVSACGSDLKIEEKDAGHLANCYEFRDFICIVSLECRVVDVERDLGALVGACHCCYSLCVVTTPAVPAL